MGLWEWDTFFRERNFRRNIEFWFLCKILKLYTAKTNTHRNKDNEQLPFSNATCPCELVLQHPIFGKQRSCVCTATTLSHRFKTSEKARRNTCRFRDKKRKQHEKNIIHRVLNRGRRTESRLLFGSFCRSKKNVKTFPFRELPDKQEVCPCRGSTLRVLFSFRKVPRLANLESSHRSHPFRKKPTKPQKTEKKGIKSSKRRKERVKKRKKGEKR